MISDFWMWTLSTYAHIFTYHFSRDWVRRRGGLVLCADPAYFKNLNDVFMLCCADRVIRYQEIPSRGSGEGFSVDVVLEGGAGANQKPPKLLLAGRGSGYPIVAQPSDSTLMVSSRGVPHHLPPVSQNQPTIQEGGKNNNCRKISSENSNNTPPGELQFVSNRRAPPTFCCALPFRFLCALPRSPYLPYPHPPLDLPAENCIVVALPCHGDLVHRLLCSTTNQIYHVHRGIQKTASK